MSSIYINHAIRADIELQLTHITPGNTALLYRAQNAARHGQPFWMNACSYLVAHITMDPRNFPVIGLKELK